MIDFTLPDFEQEVVLIHMENKQTYELHRNMTKTRVDGPGHLFKTAYFNGGKKTRHIFQEHFNEDKEFYKEHVLNDLENIAFFYHIDFITKEEADELTEKEKGSKTTEQLLAEFDNYMNNQSPTRNFHMAYIMCSFLNKTPAEIEQATGVTIQQLERYIKENNLEL